VELLPWLAWALSVDTWDSEWPESTKRALIANSVQIHKTKGTVSAIERVMNALGVAAELKEWFEFGGQPHTFRLTAWANANLVPDAEAILSPVLYRTLKRSVDNVKPVRSHYDFRVGAQFGGELGIASHATTVSTTRILAEPELTVGFNATALSTAAQIQNISYLRITMEAA
jgi:phage tail P2-like protein